jgi:hypothetical protein
MRRFIAIVFMALAGFGAALAHAQQRYAVISLIGDRMEIAYAKGVEGQPVDRIERRYIPLDDSSIDRHTLLAANEVLKKLVPGTDPVLLQAFDRSYFDVTAGTGAVIEWMRQLAKDAKPKVTHAILITKIQYEGVPAIQKAFVGGGTLEGVGFFVGREAPLKGMDPNSGGPGFLSPFAYFQVTLVDLATGKVVREEKGTASTSLSATGTDTGNPWDTLSADRKVQAIIDLVKKELEIVLPKVLKGT